MTVFNLRKRVQSFKDCEHNFKVLDWLLMGRTDHANTLLPGVIKLNEFGISCERGDEITFWLKSDGSAEFAGELKAASGVFSGTLKSVDGVFTGELQAVKGTFEWLQAGTADGARLSCGSDNGLPFLEMYDSTNNLRVNIRQEDIEFWRAGVRRGSIRAEFVPDYWRGGQIGESIFIEAEGNSIAFKAKGSGGVDGITSLTVHPSWIWASAIETGSIYLGEHQIEPVDWRLYADWVNPSALGEGQFVELTSQIDWLFTGSGFGLLCTAQSFIKHTKTQRVGFNFGQDINYHTGIYKDNVRGIPRADLKTATASVSGSLGSNLAVEIELHPYTFFPNMYGADASFFVQPHTDNEVDQIGRLLFANLAASSKSYRCRWRYIDA